MGLKWRPVLKVLEYLQDKRSKVMQTLGYFYVKYCPRVPLLLLTVEKIKHENFDLVVLLSFSFPSRTSQKVYCVYERSARQTNALLSEIFLFLVRAAYELRSMNYGPKHMARWLFYAPFCAYLHAQIED